MTLEYITSIIEANFYNGKVQDNDNKLDWDDFFQMARAANGTIMRDMWYDENQRGNANLFFADSITTERFKVGKVGRYRGVKLPTDGAVKLPYNMGILRVSPAMEELSDEEEDCEDYGNDDIFARGEPGYEYTFGSDDILDDLGEGFYVPIGNTLRLFGFPEAKYVELDYIKNDEDLDLPEAVAWMVIKEVLGPVLKVQANDVDVVDDGNPNVVTVKKRIADVQGLDGQSTTSTR